MDEKNAENELTEYVQKCLAQGIEEPDIRNSLLKAGWPADRIDTAIDRITVAKPEVQADRKRHSSKRHHLAYLAEDIMDKDISLCSSNIPVKEVLDILHKKGYVLVVENNKPRGIITCSDIVRNLDDTGKIDIQLYSQDIMSASLHTCGHQDTLLDACTKMKIKNVERIPVLKKNKLVGIITSSKLIDFMSYG